MRSMRRPRLATFAGVVGLGGGPAGGGVSVRVTLD
jgi:hypothetical protein